MINPNLAFEDEIYNQFLKDPLSVSPAWRDYFDKKSSEYSESEGTIRKNIKGTTDKHDSKILSDNEQVYIGKNDELELLSPIQSKIAGNMELSLEIPTATSLRTMPVKALDENRRIINKYLLILKGPKVTFTHVLAWAVVKTLMKYPYMNYAFIKKDGKAYKVKRKSINIGFAIDIIRKDGSRLLLVPNIKDAQNLNFSEFIKTYDELISRTRNNKLTLDDMQGTTCTLTNPGMIGTSASSPRLMKGQGLIVAVGSIDYPVEFQAVNPEFLTSFAISKVVTITSTYDHRIIQGAESAEFLAYINKLLLGEYQFYEHIFGTLNIPFEPIKWTKDNAVINQFGKINESDAIEKAAHAMLMINAYRVRGHLLASINPLGFESYYYPELDPAYYGFSIWDLDRTFHADDSWTKNNLLLRDIIEILRETYCGDIGIEFMHIQDPTKKQWIFKKLEQTRFSNDYSKEEKIHIFQKLIDAEVFENFLHTKFVGSKRFSLEGGESLIPMLDKIFELAANNDLYSIALGMAHRGRLNVLANNIGKPPQKIFNEFEGIMDPNSYHGSGDVKYHLGDEGYYISTNNKKIKIILSPNPSHLELVNPVVEGLARAMEDEALDKSYSKVLPVLIHGDSAFAGQGIVAETLNLSQLRAYSTGGTIHIIINNQIGFTTTAQDSRSSIYCTDIAKMIQVPIIHVNGNNPEAVRTAATFAYEYRSIFKTDVIIDMLCYRKYGHNEADEPSYTQPLLYKKIKSLEPVRKIYQDELIKDLLITQDDADKIIKGKINELNEIFSSRIKNEKAISNNKNTGFDIFKKIKTGVTQEHLKLITNALSSFPPDFKPNQKLIGLLKKRGDMLNSSVPLIDWAMAEALAFGSILLDKKEIRITGQDTRRGTFSQRHAVLTDIETDDIFIPLNHIQKEQALLKIYDSPLSELAVLGFEYGYSVLACNSLTIWEAQFGDFANSAQMIIDQFISCADSKWGKMSNLTMLLPHSYDGQGPEHSSARPERFLQLCAEENMIVCNLTTPAQYFHVLRRQMLLSNRKPLIIMTPKSMLRHPLAVSAPDELINGCFKELIDDDNEWILKQVQNDNKQVQNDKEQVQNDKEQVQNDKEQVQNDKEQVQNDKEQVQNDKEQVQNDKEQVQNDKEKEWILKQVQNDKEKVQNDKEKEWILKQVQNDNKQVQNDKEQEWILKQVQNDKEKEWILNRVQNDKEKEWILNRVQNDNKQNFDVNNINKLIFCTGKIYYELIEKQKEIQNIDTVIVRIEQLYPLHIELLKSILEKYKSAKEIIWVQEEPKNMGAWNYISSAFNEHFNTQINLKYIGRHEAAAVSTGSLLTHQKEQKEIVDKAFKG